MQNLTKADELAIANGAYFDEAIADRVIRFANTYVTPQFIKGRFKLLQWQEDFLRQLYGWRQPGGQRRWRRAFLTIGKKNGKSLIASIIACYELFAGETASPLVVSASTSKENAKQIFDQIKHTVTHSPKLAAITQLTPSLKKLYSPKRDAEFRSISTDSGNAEGLNLSLCLCDEVHAWVNDSLWRSLEYSTIARPDGLLIVISTAGRNKNHFYYDLYCKAKRVLSGEDLDTTFYAKVYETPDTDDCLTNPDLWKLSNPSLGTSFKEDDLRRDLEAASKSTSDLLSARRYRLNQWVQSDESWIDLAKWDLCRTTLPDTNLYPAYVGVDLSQTTDPSSVSIVWCLPDRRFAVKSWAWVAQKGVELRERGNLPLFQQFRHEGHMTITSGETIDERKVKQHIKDLCRDYKVRSCVFDPNSAYVMAKDLEDSGIECLRQPQTHKYFSPSIKAFEQAILEKRIVHDGNSWLRYCVNNVRLDENTICEVRPSKRKSADHIDGAVSTLLAFGLAYQQPDKTYQRNPLLILE